jgi:hypothetical protein
LANSFIEIWLGEKYVFSQGLVFLIVTNFYINGMRQPVLIFKEALGLYWQDRYKPIIETTLNLTISILLVQKIGIAGVLLGTIISNLVTCFWIEPYIVFKHGFDFQLKMYFKSYTINTFTLFVVGIITLLSVSAFSFINVRGFFLELVISVIVPNTLFFFTYKKSREFQNLYGLAKYFWV